MATPSRRACSGCDAARLLDPESPIIRVGFEIGPKSFDDIWVEYDPARSAARSVRLSASARARPVQVARDAGQLRLRHLVDPEFINANARSLLQRAREAQLAYAPDGIGVRFKLVTNWRIDSERPIAGDDRQPLRRAAARTSLSAPLTDNSKAARSARRGENTWASTRTSCACSRVRSPSVKLPTTLDDLRDHLDILFGLVGLRRVPA